MKKSSKKSEGKPLAEAVKGKQEKSAKKGKAKAAAPQAPVAETAPAAETLPASRQAGKARKKAERKDGRLSGLDAAAKVLADAGEPMSCKTIVERAVEKGYWKTTGKTPSATVYAAIIREIQKKGDAARFAKTERGMFALKT